MNCWAILELGDDADKKAVKRAYAKKLKSIDVESEPEKFQRLREAYEEALDFIKYGKEEEAQEFLQRGITQEQSDVQFAAEDSDGHLDDVVTEEAASPAFETEESMGQPGFDASLVAQNVMQKIDILHADPSQKGDLQAWINIFEHEDLLDLEVRNTLRYWVFEFVAQKLGASDWTDTALRTIDRQVVIYLNQVFNWHEEQLALSSYFGPDMVSAVMYEIDGNKGARDRGRVQHVEKYPLWMKIVGWIVVLNCFLIFFRSVAN